MNNRTKNSLYTIALLLAIVFVYFWRNNFSDNENGPKVLIRGNTMGTSYQVICFGGDPKQLKISIDSLLDVFNQSLNTYLSDSEISQFNQSGSITFSLPYFYPVLRESKNIYELTDGSFDPSVGPVVNLWGFGPEDISKPDSSMIDSVKQFIGFEKMSFTNKTAVRTAAGLKLDFSAIAKGYGVDVVSDYLFKKGFKNHFVEIGGEVRCLGKNIEKNKLWTVGITDPESSPGNVNLYATLSLNNKSIATSGNYYNYKEVDGIKYSHTINPETGYPIKRRILSASVITNSCMAADGLATSFMVMGHKRAIKLLNEVDSIKAFLIYSDNNGKIATFVSPELEKDLQIIK